MRKKLYDYIVIGSGPAGLQIGYYLHKAKRNYLILEVGNKPGIFFHRYPRHRQLISINKRYTGSDDSEFNLRMDWNSLLSDDDKLLFPNYSDRYFPQADDFINYLEDFASSLNLNIKFGVHIQGISRLNNFLLTDQHGTCFECKRLIVATGLSKQNLPDIPGIDLVETYATATIDPNNYINQRVLIIGKGNSAFETADNLVETTTAVHIAGRSSIQFAWKTHYVGHLRAVNNNILDTYQLKSQNSILDGDIIRIEKKGDKYFILFSFVRADEMHKELCYDRVIACTGFRFDHAIFEHSCQPQLTINNRFPALTSRWESVNVPDLFFAGTLMQARDYRKTTSGFVHGFRYCIRSLFNILEQRYHQNSWPVCQLKNNPVNLMKQVIRRVNRSSALWQQFGFLADLLVVDGNRAFYYEELPVDYIQQSEFSEYSHYFIITLEYGPDHASVDPFDIHIERVAQNDAEDALNAQYLHPVVRHYATGKFLAEHHLAENLENHWDDVRAHQNPLIDFFTNALKRKIVNEISEPEIDESPVIQAEIAH